VGILSGLLTLPLAPVRGVVWLAEQIEDVAERQWHDPGEVRRELERLDADFDAGRVTESERDERRDALVARLLPGGAARS